ncbi:XamI family restriction endonuclease [Spiribacter halobius]|uniref:XamI family restriction endonuclease n=1 Tax=Sediminicurvatus halobius TaxID=2182432 RepID=A0A2U2MYL1_9GAMM|nr:XamI family restriction endonuclease [Spiribacter halobius]PWG61809.1 XamI family restriction endonuclease [Spiribacter halobius]UEX77648.1 XamI family restriction endonuclease [Spiribacter halobius]
MIKPPRWSDADLKAEVEQAIALFRHERLDEPVEVWRKTFDAHDAQFRTLFEKHGAHDLKSMTADQVVSIFEDNLGDALRYLAGPPISEDDLKVLADASLAPSRLKQDDQAAERILSTIVQALDSKRFPWVAENREPTDAEKRAAVLTSAALITAQRVSTLRRNDGKNKQEGGVKEFLRGIGFQEIAPRTIRTLADAPGAGQFCGECLVGSRKADIPIRLYDGRLMPVECKVSNSSTNSVKRVNNDASVKAGIWRRELGENQVVPAAVLSGVFNVRNLKQAQDSHLTLFWAHDLDKMGEFIEKTR